MSEQDPTRAGETDGAGAGGPERQPGRLTALGPLKHACHACGSCCEGWHIRVVDADEEAAIAARGAALGVERPTEAGILRMVDGRCVFLDAARRCRIHSHFGLEAKPKVCQQFPRRATRTEAGVRVGLDPACISTAVTWASGPEVPPLPAMHEARVMDAELAAVERDLIGLTFGQDASIARFVAVLCAEPHAPGELPPAFAHRLCKALAAFDLAGFLATPNLALLGPDARGYLAHVAPRLRTLDPAEPPRWAGVLAPDVERFALEVLRRHLFLRLGDEAVPPFAQALLILMGVVAIGWASAGADAAERFAPALSTWARLVRGRTFWGLLLPDSDHARWLVTG